MLIDTNILIRAAQPHHPLYAIAETAIRRLALQGHELQIVPQNLIEFWAVATRPSSSNGLGLGISEALLELERLKSMFLLLPETGAIYPAWEALVRMYQVSGKPTHDARLVAAMQVHGVTSILTFNVSDFKRYAGIKVFDPAVAAGSTQKE